MNKRELEEEAEKLEALARRARLSYLNADTQTAHERRHVEQLEVAATVARHYADKAGRTS